jgi:hypothetical protein
MQPSATANAPVNYPLGNLAIRLSSLHAQTLAEMCVAYDFDSPIAQLQTVTFLKVTPQ